MNESIEMWQLKQRQGLSLSIKEEMSLRRIRIWNDEFLGKIYVSFSGGKDSTVLLHLVRRELPKVTGVFIDTGLEYPEVREFVRTINNIIWLKPKMNFKEVIKKYGYPIISKEVAYKVYEIRNTKSKKLKNKRLHGDDKGNGKLSEKWKFLIKSPFKISDKCCDILKVNTVKKYERESGNACIIGSMASESRLRLMTYLRKGCNFIGKRSMCSPIAFWTDKDIWDYIKKYDLKYSRIYNLGYERTGCMFCMFGIHLNQGKSKFDIMRKTHPMLYDYCINKLGCGDVIRFVGINID
jgi:3'-phosphoadenosine 5'-phosphosulfate sulfotransferase (PAPS reductase)/FAD synthetase